MSDENKKPYISRAKSQTYRPAGPKESMDIVMEYRGEIVEITLRVLEILGKYGREFPENKVAAEKFEKVEHFVAVNNGWAEKKYKGHEPIKHKDRRAEGKQSGNLHCDECNHSFDLWQAKCPRCTAQVEKKLKAVQAENDNFKSFFNMIVGDEAEITEIHINQNFPLNKAFTSIPKKRRGMK